MKLFMISCKKATYLLSKKEENKISWLEKIELSGHLLICSMCRRFEEQTGLIIRNAKHTHAHSILSQKAKDRMQAVLKD